MHVPRSLATGFVIIGTVLLFGLVFRPTRVPMAWRGALTAGAIAVVFLGATWRVEAREYGTGESDGPSRGEELLSSDEAKAWLQRVVAQAPANGNKNTDTPSLPGAH